MTDLVEGEDKRYEFRWRKASTGLLDTGSPTVEFWVEDGDTKKWLQADRSLADTRHAFDLTWDSDDEAWVFEFDNGVPSALTGHVVALFAEHPDHAVPFTQTFRVTKNSLDTVASGKDYQLDF